MSDLSNNSFIPKRGKTKSRRGSSSRQIYVFTFISYLILFTTLIASGGVFFYSDHVEKQLQAQVTMLNSEIENFNEVDMQKVIEFDRKLTQASDRLNYTASAVSVLQALEGVTNNNVLIKTLTLNRQLDESFNVSLSVETDSFDGTISQRNEYLLEELINSVEISGVSASNLNTNVRASTQGEGLPTVVFIAEFEVPLSDVPYDPSQGLEELFVTETTVPPALSEEELDPVVEEVVESVSEDNSENI